MYCPQQVTYAIRHGDNLYQLAKYYKTTVPRILALNPDTDPYNLQLGAKILICPGEDFNSQPMNPPSCPDFTKEISLINDMRLAWEQHGYWTRMVIISIIERLKDEDATVSRLLRNPHDLARIFANYYSHDIATTISQLVTEHLQIGAALITATRDKNTAQADMLNRQWYANADKMARFFSSINPNYNEEDFREMLHMHLDLIKQEVAMRLAGNYPADIKAFDEMEKEILKMADTFTLGLMRQFPQMFG